MLKKTEKKSGKKTEKKEDKKKITKKIIKEPTKEKTKKKIQKEESYFFVLLKKSDLLFASWKIDSPKWKKRIEVSETDPAKKDYLFIEVSSIENGKYIKIDTIPVHGIENNWHLFVKNQYRGKKLIFNLSYRDNKEKFYDILISGEINIPLSIEDIKSLREENILLELSEIKLAGISGKENTSW